MAHCLSRLVVSLTVSGAVFGGGVASAAGETPRANSSQVLVWVRPANDLEMRLSEKDVPALRTLARNGLCLPRLHPLTPRDVVVSLHRLRKDLGRDYREIGSAAGRERSGVSSLVAEFGKPPPVSDEEEEALRRLREASKKRTEPPGEPAEEKKPSSSPRDPERQSVSATVNSVVEGLASNVRLLVASSSTPPEAGEATAALDQALAEIIVETGIEESGPEDRKRPVIVVILVPADGPPGLIAAGHGIRRGRVSRRQLDAGGITDLVALLLGIPRDSAPDAGWLFETGLESGASAAGGKP